MALLILLTVEFVIFRTMVVSHHAWIFPRWFDQTQYLTEAYLPFEHYRIDGLLSAIDRALATPAPQGGLHAVLGLLAFVVAGPSRATALSLNFLAVAILQLATFQAFRRLAGPAIAWIAVALLAALHFPWSGVTGSAMDFRLDCMAACAFGTTLAAAFRTHEFRSLRGCAVFGAAVGVTILARYLTAVYFAVIFVLLGAALLAYPDRWRRCRGLLVAGVVAAILAGPALWHSRNAIHDYYWLGHMDGPERALRVLPLGFLGSISWLVTEVVAQVGPATLTLAGIAALTFWAGARLKATALPEDSGPGQPASRMPWLLTTCFFLGPAAVLAVHSVKAPQPLSIMTPCLVAMAVLVVARLKHGVRRGLVVGVSGAMVLAGTLVFARAVSAPPRPDSNLFARRINALSDYINYRAEEAGLNRPRVAITQVSDGLNAGTLSLMGYERQRRWLAFEATLPTGIFETSAELVRERVAGSDFVCLAVAVDSTPWPFDRQLMQLRPELESWCDANLRKVGNVATHGVTFAIYERPLLARPSGPGGVDFSKLLAAADRSDLDPAPMPPGPPVFQNIAYAWSTAIPCEVPLGALYTPLTFRVTELPEGTFFDPRSNRIRGSFLRPGSYTARVVATNAAGATPASLEFVVSDERAFAVVPPRLETTAGVPVPLPFSAFDANGQLNYIDVTDLTTQQGLARLAPSSAELKIWRGVHRLVFSQPGTHHVLLRFVSYDPARQDPYTFFDRACEIDVRP